MATVALVSAKGAPGVTTAALALTLTWPSHVLLAECDPGAGNAVLAGYGQHLTDVSQGLIGLALAERHGQWGEAMLWAQTMQLSEGKHLLPGLAESAQAASIAPLWSRLASTFTSLERGGVDVLIDAGRLGAVHTPMPLLRQADVVLLVTRSNLPAISAARAHLSALRADLAERGTGPDGLGLLVVGEGQPYSAREIAASLQVPVLTCLAWDPLAADVYTYGTTPHRRHANSAFLRSVRASHDPISQLLAQRVGQLRASRVPVSSQQSTAVPGSAVAGSALRTGGRPVTLTQTPAENSRA